MKNARKLLLSNKAWAKSKILLDQDYFRHLAKDRIDTSQLILIAIVAHHRRPTVGQVRSHLRIGGIRPVRTKCTGARLSVGIPNRKSCL